MLVLGIESSCDETGVALYDTDAGGTLLTLADTAARTVIAPQQLPVGVLTALIGVPVFLFLLARHPR